MRPFSTEEREHADSLSDDEIDGMFLEEEVVTACPHGCYVDPDGTCQHGYRSALIVLGIH